MWAHFPSRSSRRLNVNEQTPLSLSENRQRAFAATGVSECYDRVEMGPTTEGPTLRFRSRATVWRVALLAGSIAAISFLRQVTGPSGGLLHELSLRLYYVPILLSAYWFGVGGGLVVAFISATAYVNHMLPNAPKFDAARYAEVVVFHVVAVTVGVLANAQRRVTARYQRAAETLESANRDLRESHEEIRRIDRLKTVGEIAMGLAHEIRHPLASIRGALEIIEARSVTDSPEAEFSQLAMSEVQRLDRLVWEFLTYARPHDPELRAVPLHEVVAQVVRLLRVEAERARVVLDVEPAETPIEVLIDPLQIEQVLLNVVLNAIQATPPGRRILVREQLDVRQALIDVIDQGPGIPSDHLSAIFNPFFTTREQGTGLGLAIANRIVVAHQGSIDVHETSGRGTCFRLHLPLVGASETAARAAVSEVAT
jgi:two-component system sensor histidine kinase HydH